MIQEDSEQLPDAGSGEIMGYVALMPRGHVRVFEHLTVVLRDPRVIAWYRIRGSTGRIITGRNTGRGRARDVRTRTSLEHIVAHVRQDLTLSVEEKGWKIY